MLEESTETETTIAAVGRTSSVVVVVVEAAAGRKAKPTILELRAYLCSCSLRMGWIQPSFVVRKETMPVPWLEVASIVGTDLLMFAGPAGAADCSEASVGAGRTETLVEETATDQRTVVQLAEDSVPFGRMLVGTVPNQSLATSPPLSAWAPFAAVAGQKDSARTGIAVEVAVRRDLCCPGVAVAAAVAAVEVGIAGPS